jgi:hypothetical protein
MQGTEPWRFTDGDKIVTVHPHGRFKADNGAALIAATTAGIGIAWPTTDTVIDVARDFDSVGDRSSRFTLREPAPVCRPRLDRIDGSRCATNQDLWDFVRFGMQTARRQCLGGRLRNTSWQ